ncbi:hypothetical protein J2S00_003794, partial [Caldalkalibacillus uzonensis]
GYSFLLWNVANSEDTLPIFIFSSAYTKYCTSSPSKVIDQGDYFTVKLIDEKDGCRYIFVDIDKQTGKVVDKRKENNC